MNKKKIDRRFEDMRVLLNMVNDIGENLDALRRDIKEEIFAIWYTLEEMEARQHKKNLTGLY